MVKFSRSFFSESATQEMLDLWRPLLCPYDRSITTGLKYFELFLSTSADVPKEKTHELWRVEFMTLWESFGNRFVPQRRRNNLFCVLSFISCLIEVSWTSRFKELYLGYNLQLLFNSLRLISVRVGRLNCSNFTRDSLFTTSAESTGSLTSRIFSPGSKAVSIDWDSCFLCFYT